MLRRVVCLSFEIIGSTFENHSRLFGLTTNYTAHVCSSRPLPNFPKGSGRKSAGVNGPKCKSSWVTSLKRIT